MNDESIVVRQGSLDFMCSVYAAINLLYYYGALNELDDAAVPFRRAVDFMNTECDWDLAGAICEGVDEEDCIKLFEELSGYHWDVDKDVAQRYKARFDRLERLKNILEGGVKAVIVSLIRYTNRTREVVHYTVVTGLNSESLAIRDSQGKIITRKGNNLQYDGEEVSLGCFYIMQSQ